METLTSTSLPNKDILFLTRTPSLQKRLKRLNERREKEVEREKGEIIKGERQRENRGDSLMQTAQ